jgi:hypothetical protein
MVHGGKRRSISRHCADQKECSAFSTPYKGRKMSNPANPELIAMLQAILQFNANIGPDPQQWPLKVPGALTVLMGTVSLQLPALAQAEAGALQADVNTKISALIAKLQAG